MKFPVLITITLFFIASACSSNKENSYYSMEKKYWDVEDYKLAITQLNFDNTDQKELPNLDNPANASIFKKLVDTANISVVATDEQLGIAHRAAFTSSMFDEYKDLNQAYAVTDRTDKYKYAKEYTEVLKFGLLLQLYYIQSNNGKILKEADNTQDPEVVRVVTNNQNVLVNNFNLYLDHINREDQFTDAALANYAAGIDLYFPRLVAATPNGDYSQMIEKVHNMLTKTTNPAVKESLQRLSTLLQTKHS